jgi:hypothetical protein
MSIKILITLILSAFCGILYAQNVKPNGPDQIGGYNTQKVYYDTKQIPDSLNFNVYYSDEKKDHLFIIPKQGKWSNLFLMYPDSLITLGYNPFAYCSMKDLNLVARIDSHKANVFYKGKAYTSKAVITDYGSSGRNPMCIPFTNANSFFIFGDYYDENKWYVYDYGKVLWMKSDKNFRR